MDYPSKQRELEALIITPGIQSRKTGTVSILNTNNQTVALAFSENRCAQVMQVEDNDGTWVFDCMMEASGNYTLLTSSVSGMCFNISIRIFMIIIVIMLPPLRSLKRFEQHALQ